MATEKRGLESFQNVFDFLFTCCAFTFGLNDLWNFPGIVKSYGGLSFLILYFICLLFLGWPVLMVELTIGRRFQGSFVHDFGRMNKFFWGLGISIMVTCLYTSAYYATNAGYAILYVIKSFERPLPWLKLRNNNDTILFPDQVFSYYTDEILEYEKDLDTLSDTQFLWKIFLATFSVWIIVFLCLVSGVKSLGKVVYFLFLYPLSVIIAMFIVAINKEGGFEGIKESFDADFSMLKKADTWLVAVEQVIFGLALGLGPWISLASRSPVRRSVLLDSFIFILVKLLVTFTLTIGVFAINGYFESEGINTHLQAEPEENLFDGKLLIYVTLAYFTDSISSEKWVTSFIAVLFFVTVFTLTLAPICILCENIVFVFSSIKLLSKIPYLVKLAIISTLGVAVSCIFHTPHGLYFLELMEKYGFQYPVLFITLTQLLFVGWFHGIHRLSRDFAIVNDFQPYWLLKFIWKYFSPVAILAALFWKLFQDGKDDSLFLGSQTDRLSSLFSPSLNPGYSYPNWAIILSPCILFSIFLWVPLGALVSCCVSLDFGKLHYDEKRLISFMEPKEYSCIERVVCCISEEFDFPENITLRYTVPLDPQNQQLYNLQKEDSIPKESRNSSILSELEDFTIFSQTTRF